MSDVVFNPGENNNFGFRGERGGSGSVGVITKLVMKLTGIEDEKQANQALVVLAVLCFVASGIILWTSF